MVQRVKDQAARLRQSRDTRLTQAADRLRDDVREGADILSEPILVGVFALVYEAVRRLLGTELYDVQLAASVVLAQGAIAEMQTGEGKTLAAAAPAALHALAGKGVHVVTVNAYLAHRDWALLKPVYEMLGLSAGLLEAGTSWRVKRQAYGCDITYGPGYEFGFDYLRDQVGIHRRSRLGLGQTYRTALRGHDSSPDSSLQRPLGLAIVDEVDSVLIDEARLPLILSIGPTAEDAQPNTSIYQRAHDLAAQLVAERDYVLDDLAGEVHLTECGYAAAQRFWSDAGRPPVQRPWTVYVENALWAGLLLHRDIDYLVAGGQVQIVDECTGRIHADRSWQEGLHQAVEVKERVSITAEKQSVARISRQRFFRLYQSLCGMTGTARGAEREFWELYRLPVVAIPLRTHCRRRVLPMRFFADRAAKWQAMLEQLISLHRSGRPIMVGTRNIQQSEQFSQLLARQKIDHCLLNGKQDRNEAEIVAQAGQIGAVTIATGIAGRGTDIRLSPSAVERGGLHVLGEECQDASRIDRQLIGRSARQGDPGSCQFFVSADDRLVRDHDRALHTRLGQRCDGRGEIHADLSARITRIQRRVDRQNHSRRRQLLRQDRWLEELVDRLAN